MFRWFSFAKRALSDLHTPLIVLVVAAIGISLVTPISGPGMVRSREAASRSNAKQLSLACKEYAIDNDGNFPPSLDALFPTYLNNRSLLISPFNPSDPAGYIYTAGLKDEPPYDAIMIEDKFAPSIEHERIIVYANGIMCTLRFAPGTESVIGEAMKNAKALGRACEGYAHDHDGDYPASLEVLIPHYLASRSCLVSPFMPSEPAGYYYRPGLRMDTSSAGSVLIADKFAELDHCGIIVYADGTVQVVGSWPPPTASGT